MNHENDDPSEEDNPAEGAKDSGHFENPDDVERFIEAWFVDAEKVAHGERSGFIYRANEFQALQRAVADSYKKSPAYLAARERLGDIRAKTEVLRFLQMRPAAVPAPGEKPPTWME